MTNPLVTLGVPVYRGQDRLPGLLDCLRTQSYKEIDVLISVDGGDQASAEACKPFLQQDTRFRMQVQPARLGWAGNTDWTMLNRRGDFYIYQQHDDLLSPTYVADLVEASVRWPNAAICFSKVQFTGLRRSKTSVPSLLGDPKERALAWLRRLDWVPFRGLIRGSSLGKTAGLLLSEFDPFDSWGTEHRLMAELSLLGEFRFVEGPTYYKDWHGENLSIRRREKSREHWVASIACWAAWMIEVIVPTGASAHERRGLLLMTLERFTGRRDPLWLLRSALRRSETLKAALGGFIQLGRPMIKRNRPAECGSFLRQVAQRLKSGGRFDPQQSLSMTWQGLETEIFNHYQLKPS